MNQAPPVIPSEAHLPGRVILRETHPPSRVILRETHPPGRVILSKAHPPRRVIPSEAHLPGRVILSDAQHPRRVILSGGASRRSRRTCVSLLPALALLLTTLAAQQPAPTLAARLATMLQRDASGHSPTSEELLEAQSLDPLPTPAELQQALPIILLALESSDTPVRTYALSTLVALQSPAAGDPNAGPATLPNAYQPAVARLLTPAIPKIAPHLIEESQPNRLLTAAILAGFTPDPPPTVYPPLLAFLRRDNAVGTTGTAVVNALLQLGPLTPATAEALARYLRRSDQTHDSRANLADLIAASPHQSPVLNQTLTAWIDSDDPALRARVILSLPQLDLAPATFADLHARIAALADNSTENLQVTTAAKAITTCWTAPHPSTPCPAYPTP